MGLNEKFFRSADEDGPSFNTVTYEGDGNADRDITGLGFTPDFVWTKNRSTSDSHQLYDSLRDNYGLYSNGTDAQFLITDWEIINDGFDLGAANNGRNGNGNDIVAWCWKAGGAPSGSDTVSIDGTSYADEAAAGLTAGTIAVSGLSVNTDLGFSIAKVVDHTGTPTISHGLGTAPELIMTKVLDSSSYNWYVYHKDLGNTKYLNLNTINQAVTDNFWNNTSPTSQVFTHRFSNIAFDMIYYCFASVAGVSKVGSYTGTGAVGKEIVTGFEPAFVMVKRTNGSGDWMMHDNKRSANNGDGQDLVLYANLNNSEDQYSSGGVVFNDDGFTLNVTVTSTNLSGGEYIYYAVAEGTVLDSNPFSLDYLIVAGGGGGGNYYYAGGGGAGGMLTSYGTGNISGGLQPVAATPTLDTGINYTVTVGAGGGGASTGNNSVFNTVTSTGGGYGAGGSSVGAVAGTGGSGGGGDDYGAAIPGGARTSSPIQGFAGGSNPATDNRTGSGGGGAGSTGIGSNASVSLAGLGGDGLASSITGSSVVYAAGGGAAQNATNFGVVGQDNGGSSGIGGKGARYTTNSLDAPSLGDINTGSGGGGGCHIARHPNGAGGGAGVVVLRYPSSRTITLSVGLTGTTATDGTDKVTVITEGTGTVSFA